MKMEGKVFGSLQKGKEKLKGAFIKVRGSEDNLEGR